MLVSLESGKRLKDTAWIRLVIAANHQTIYIYSMKNSGSKTIGVLSDTHLYELDDTFRNHAVLAFSGCEAIIHAGDLTSRDILDVFRDKEVYAVHGNMCGFKTRASLPESLEFTIEDYRFGLYHGDGIGYDIETGLISRFGEVDCIVSGHTHRPLVHKFNSVLLVNPGTFRGTGRYGSSGTYAILTIDEGGLSAAIHTLPPE
ncbi:MAG: metallophosphoesterase family protein [Desulfocapsaceae bacterium]